MVFLTSLDKRPLFEKFGGTCGNSLQDAYVSNAYDEEAGDHMNERFRVKVVIPALIPHATFVYTALPYRGQNHQATANPS
jgi:hypothetical protein